MKKLFTTLILIGFALCSWADPVISGSVSTDADGVKVLTVEYTADANVSNFLVQLADQGPKQFEDALGLDAQDFENVGKVVLVGDFANYDFTPEGKFVEKLLDKCAGKGHNKHRVYLDLTDCSGIVSKISYLPGGTEDWESDDFKIVYSNATKDQQVVYSQKFFYNDKLYSGDYLEDQDGYYYTVWYDVATNKPYNGDVAVEDMSVDQETGKKYYNALYDIDNDEIYTGDENSLKTENVLNENDEVVGTKRYYEEWLLDGNPPTNENNWMLAAVQNGQTPGNTPGVWNEAHTIFTFTGYDGNNHTVNYNKHYVEERTFFVEERRFDLEARNVWSYEEGNKTIVIEDETLVVHEEGATTGTIQVAADGSALTFTKIKDFIYGVTFPSSNNFTAIPDNICQEFADFTSVDFGSAIWIGEDAFKGTGLTDVDFPANLKVIAGEAFDGSKLTEIDLSGCTSLVAIKYEAFEGCRDVETLTFPSSGSNFTFLGNDAFKDLTSLETLDMQMCSGITEFQSKNDDGSTYKTFYGCTALKTVILPPNLTAVPDDYGMGVFQACGAIETLEFTGTPRYNECELLNPCTIGDNAFAFNYNLNSITFSKNISHVGYQAFHSAAITTVSIPASVKDLAKHSFYGCTKLTTVIFEEFDKQYGTCDGEATRVAGAQGAGGQGQGAFEECQAITDVYINTMAELNCDNNAFDQDISWGAGDAGANFATLHFPKEKTEHYVNLQHYLTDEIVTNPGKFHEWLEEHYDQAIVPHKNGWYEFINSGPSAPEDGPVYQSIILRTFSDYDYAYLVPSGLRAYVVNRVEPNSNGQYEVTLQRLNVIPKRTGVILYGHPNGRTQGGKPALVLTPVKFLETGDPLFDQKYNDAGELVKCEIEYNADGTMKQQDEYRGPDQGAALCRANWNSLDKDHQIYKNYLEPLLSQYGTDIKPYETVKVDGVNKVKFRNFALGRYTSTDYYTKETGSPLNDDTNFVGFFRMKAQSYKSGYAYLHVRGEVDEEGHSLPYTNTVTGEEYVSEYATADGGEILVNPDEPKVNLDKNIYPYYWEVMIKDGQPYSARGDNMGNATYNPKRWWDEDASPVAFTWREYTMSWGSRNDALVNPNAVLKYFGELENDVDGVVKVVIPARSENDTFYTLQGVRVTNPTKGVYIQNGKKVIIK